MEATNPLAYIRRIEMRGFKTFGSKKVTIPLDRGFTVITGPNGSGKSNILDAIRFVLGDLSARSLRTDKMSEVIFDGGKNGSSGAASIAHVSVLLDNSNRQIPVDTDTVTISRRVDMTGVSDYLLNGKQVPRSQLVDILSMAGLSVAGYNMVMQGTITRLADITPEERRKLIEELIGIGEYDAKKDEAQIQLQQAETNLRIASARIGDVQARLVSLEEERNDALRYNFIQMEMKQLQAVLTSFRLSCLEADRVELVTDLKQKVSHVEDIKMQQNKLQSERNSVELERRKFDEEVADKGNIRLIGIQDAIGEIMANMAKLKMEVETGTTNLRGLTRIREERAQHLLSLETTIQETRKSLSGLVVERDRVKQDLDEKTATHYGLSSKLVEMKQNLGVNSTKIKDIENNLNKLSRQKLKLDTKLKTNTIRQKIVADNLKTLKDRQVNFESTFKALQEHFIELEKLLNEEQDSLSRASETLNNNLNRKQNLISEIDDAEKMNKIAEAAIIEFKTQTNFAERIITDDTALQRIVEMSETGAIDGIFGKLENLIKVTPKYQRAIEVASSGWLKAVVVKDVESALKCVESLKKMKIGRIKIIPLNEIVRITSASPPNISGVMDSASAFIKFDEKYSAAVNFVFGDTIITSGEKSAFLASKAGYRAVDLNGDLYEASGGIESGYYRIPIELSSLIPNEKALDELSKSVQLLEKILSKRKSDINIFDNETSRLTEERIRRTDIINSIERELNLINQNITRSQQNIHALNTKMRIYQKYLQRCSDFQLRLQSERGGYKNQINELISQRRSLTFKVEPSSIAKYETDDFQLNTELNELNRQFVKIENDIGFLEKNLETTLKPEFERAKIDLRALDRQILLLQDRTRQAKASFDEANKQFYELKTSKENLSASLVSVKGERKEFEQKLDKVDEQLKKLTKEYDFLADEAHRREMENQTKSLDINRLKEELRILGYENPLSVTSDEMKNAESSLNLLRFEFEKLGSVNQLAVTQYDEQQSNYKQLSIRLYQLESEKKSILDFMEEIERKKRETFTEAYKKINENFAKFFLKLTGGGVGYLSLQNQENPFAGGIDIFVQFPGKNSRLIAGASGGEKSVAAVAFIFTIQNLAPAPFYMFDEIDAHLDAYNSERLADLLKEQSAISQFLVITLRDVIMDRADRLFGVYIQNGVSGIVSTKIIEVAA